MSAATFRLAYSGEAVSDGEMEVADLAPALLAMAQLLKAAARVAQGDEAEIGVRVKTVRDGSFEVLLNLVVNDAKVVWSLWKSPDVQAATTLLALLGFTVKDGVIGVVRRLRGRTPRRVRSTDETVVLEVDGDEFEVPDLIARLSFDAAVRSALEKVIAEPLEKEGIETVSLGEPRDGPTINKAEAAYFRAPIGSPTDEFVSKYTKAFSIVTLSFQHGQKWRLNDGRASRLVTMSDEDFVRRVDEGLESLAKGDVLICEVVETSRRTSIGFKSDLEIVHMVEHRQFRPTTSLFGDA